ncbi:heavy metal translocating P-type ATPase [Tessaracoccus antarcticus]|uniref:Cation-transporting P-type ATPase B n=1 Tax=Tessaracoccus antarcticus TaxID=2479848 RepID=A0A3M0G9R9_9ACTN|nr:heavy metal translocating P-type ATPase [Tessaracoccus antarcticus]RMB61670.1 copper-translocating P-type ATPase [Tessaracoccus antarcticus]
MTSTQQDLRKTAGVDISLDIEGMTCASCANRIQKKLNKVDGVVATVNYATEKAAVQAPRGMSAEALIAVVEQAGYGARRTAPETPRADRADVLKPRMLLAFALAVPVVAVSMAPALQFPGWQWAALVLTAVIVFWCGRSFHAATWANLRHGTTTMDTLVTMGTVAAFGWSVVALFFGHAGMIGMRHEFTFALGRSDPMGNVYFEAAAAIIAFLLLGRWIEARSKKEAGAAVRALMEVGAKEAVVLRDGVEVRIPAGELSLNDNIVVRPGEKVAADGEVVEGTSAVDASIITGESLPVEVSPGSTLVGGSVNATGRLVVRATAVGSATQVAQIARLVEEAQTGKANAQRLADRVTTFFVPAVIGIAAVTFLLHWAFGSGLTFALTAGIAVLIIACPCALGLATPSALLVGTGRGAQLGIIIRGPQALEKARSITTIVLDKTGTLTTGSMSVLSVEPAMGVDERELLAVAAAVEAGSEHPIAQAVVTQAGESGYGADATAAGFVAVPGKGVTADVVLHGRASTEVAVGSRVLLDDMGVPVDATAGVESDVIGSEVYVARSGQFLGRIVVGDQLKPSALHAVVRLRELGLEPVLLTGDNLAAAQRVAAEVGIEQVRAGVLPQGKADAIEELRSGGHRVAMVGDGVNDAAALASADLGIAMGAGTDAAIAASDITLMRDDLLSVVDAVRLSRATDSTIKSNLAWAFGYNVLAIPIAALGMLTPMIAGAAMAFSSVFVMLNSLRLKGFREEKRQ